MLFNLALISGFIIAPAVLAHLWSGFPDRVQLSTYDVTDGVLYNPYSSGAMWNEPYYVCRQFMDLVLIDLIPFCHDGR